MSDEAVTYWYEGRSPQTGEWLQLPRTRQVEAYARQLMQSLGREQRFNREGKMYGVLLVENSQGDRQLLKAFSGLLHGEREVDGWVPPIPGRSTVALAEAATLSQLEAIKQELIRLQTLPERSCLTQLQHHFADQLHQLETEHKQRKELRQQQRQIFQETLSGEALKQALAQLEYQSQQDGIQRRKLKINQKQKLQPLQQIVENADLSIQYLKQERKQLSRQLQHQMETAYWLTNFAGQSSSLDQLMPNGIMPTGTGDCCAPKLLHYAATHGLKPLAMAEFWWGNSSPDDRKIPGKFYGACRDRCQPLMGFLLSGLSPSSPQISRFELSVLYEDEWLIAIDKPTGLLSVPGRYRQDSVVSQLRSSLPGLYPVHRLDQDTSGILLLAKDLSTYRHLSQQFQQRQVHKKYEAILAGIISIQEGTIDLPLWGDPADRPCQKVDWQRGKPSVTNFRVLATTDSFTRMELLPLTGRTHQLRVHAADRQGLGVPILGDRLYSDSTASRLHLHARVLTVQHPQTGRSLPLQSPVPF